MRKLAVFVEGQTEQLFLQRLIIELAGRNNVNLKLQNRRGDAVLTLYGESQCEHDDRQYFVLIYDCQGDSQVKAKIVESSQRLAEEDYSVVLGLMDLFPFALEELPLLIEGLAKGIPDTGVPTRIHVAVSEVEAWFLQEASHFSVLNPKMSPSFIKERVGFDPTVDCAEKIPHPAEFLRKIYNTVNLTYRKRREHVVQTVFALDIENLCVGCNDLIPSFVAFNNDLNRFLTKSGS